MQDDEYFVPYLVAKGKYASTKTWLATCNQHGGLTMKSGLYAVFYNRTELNNYLQINNTSRDKIQLGVTEKGKTFFPSIDKLRKNIGVNGWFVKDGEKVAERVNNPSAIFSFLKFIGNDKLYDKLVKIYNETRNTNITSYDFKNKIKSTPASESKFDTILKFTKDKHDVTVLQSIADKINENTNSKINAVFLVDISRFSKNELIKDISLNDVTDDVRSISADDIKQFGDIADVVDPKKLKSGEAVANTEMDNKTAQSGGFLQCAVDENILVGGRSDVEEFFSMFLLIFDFLFAMDALKHTKVHIAIPNSKPITIGLVNSPQVRRQPTVSHNNLRRQSGGISSDEENNPKVLTNAQLDEIFNNVQLGGYKRNTNNFNDEPNVAVYDEPTKVIKRK